MPLADGWQAGRYASNLLGATNFIGVIKRATSWMYHGTEMFGYEILFSDGTECLPTADFTPHIVGAPDSGDSNTK